jgi:hypothetical protein
MKTSTYNSSTVKSSTYDENSRIFTVTFTNGHVYEYSNVDLATYNAFEAAPSKGHALNDLIREQFSYVKIA